jgi:hypothetical protein
MRCAAAEAGIDGFAAVAGGAIAGPLAGAAWGIGATDIAGPAAAAVGWASSAQAPTSTQAGHAAHDQALPRQEAGDRPHEACRPPIGGGGSGRRGTVTFLVPCSGAAG